jgi:hypothetical protein
MSRQKKLTIVFVVLFVIGWVLAIFSIMEAHRANAELSCQNDYTLAEVANHKWPKYCEQYR